MLNAKDYGIPQNRERVFVISVRNDVYLANNTFIFPNKEPLQLRLKDLLQQEVEEKYYLSEKNMLWLAKHNETHVNKGTGFIFKPKTEEDTANCIRANSAWCPTDNAIVCVTQNNIVDKENAIQYINKDICKTVRSSGHGSVDRHSWDLVAEPLICASRGRNPEDPSDRTVGAPTEQRLEINKHGISNTLTTVHKDNYVLEPKITDTTNYRIRKLTPTECWRLMGFTDEDINKCIVAGISNSQLYKQAGNSIVVQVAEKLLQALISQTPKNTTLQSFIDNVLY